MAGLLLLLGASTLHADFDPALWRYSRPIEAPAADAGVIRFRVDPELYETCLPDLSDLRILDGAGREVPYVSRLESGASRRTAGSCEACGPYNQTYVPGRSTTATFHLGSESRMKTALRISTPGKDFRREVKVEGSEDGRHWEILREGALLFDIRETPDGKPFRKDEVSVPPSNHPYLRVTVFNGPGDPRRLEITGIGWEQETGEAPTLEPVPVRVVSIGEDGENRLTEILLDGGTRNRPLHSLRLDFQEENFYRRVEVAGRNSEAETVKVPAEDDPDRTVTRRVAWTPVAQKDLYRMTAGKATDSDLGIDLDGAAYRFLRVRIHDADDRPLTLREARADAVVHHILFPAVAGSRYTLFCGNRKARRPVYDLAHFLPRLERERVTDATLGEGAENPAPPAGGRAGAWSERHPQLLWAALLLGVGTLAWLIAVLARGRPPSA